MSLLLKALKQAEAGDKGGADARAPDRRSAAPDFDLEPLGAPGIQGREWVEPPSLLFGNGEAPPAAPAAARRFDWPRLSLVPATALFAVVIALGYGAYLYFALQPPAAVAPPTPAALPVSSVERPPAPSAQADAASVPVAAVPVASAPAAAPAVAAPAVSASTTRPATAALTTPAPRLQPQQRPAAPAPSAPAMPSFRPDAESAALTRGYAAYQRGALDEAQGHYAQAAAGGRNVDALLGLAAVASAQGHDADALRLYRQVLERDPRNAIAQGALLDLLGSADSPAAESRLKTLIERSPSPQLYQSLGNLYAGQQRWSDAQAAYFEAWRGAPDNADYAFNLAVSLDQLRQYAAALTYYQKALTAGGAHRFDHGQAEARAEQLKALR
ncbi:tetratricopeptide repeat protein [Betaproteobacteria bacterium SCN1]|nr:tetratricopeptide repeat protein [Betaproteobacteria bacterium SCN1]